MESKPLLVNKDIGADKNPLLIPVVDWYNSMIAAYDRNAIKSKTAKGFVDWLESLLEMKIALVKSGRDPRMILGIITVTRN